jgi:hypothetical protein
LRPAFPDIYELGIGPVVLVETSGSPPFGRDLATSSQDVRIVPDDSVTLQEIRSGASFPHTVALHELPGNCTVADSSSDSVAVRSNAFLALPLVQADTTRATLFADCIPMGAMRIRTVTTGPDPVKRHTLTLTRRDKVGSGKGTPPLNLTIPGGSTPPDTVIDKLVPANPANGANGRIDATLDAGRRNCAVAKPATHQATITSGDTALAEFRITCVPLGHVRIRTTTSDPDAAAPSEAITYALAAIAKDPRDRVTGADRAAGADGVAGASASVGATDTAMVDGLVPLYNASGATGGHDVTLSNAPDRCVETAQFTRSVTVFPGDTALAPFAIQCVERLHVSTHSTGPGSDGDGYTVVIENSDGSADSVAIAVNDTVGIAGVTPGQHVIRLVDVDPGCNAPPSTNATVSGRDSTLVAFSVH